VLLQYNVRNNVFAETPPTKWILNVEERIRFAEEYAVKRGWLIYGEMYVALLRDTEQSSYCDTMKICNTMSSKKVMVE
jgi:hypothetical protein